MSLLKILINTHYRKCGHSPAYRAWQKTHANLITPHIIKFSILKNGYIVELSEGTGLENEPYFGVTLLCYKGDKIASCYGEDRNRSGRNKHALENYYHELIKTVAAWPEV